jgi:hypothetical protein
MPKVEIRVNADAKQAEDAEQDAQIATLQAFKADSLARIGGGGGVYTGQNEVIVQLRARNEILRSIAGKGDALRALGAVK